MEERSCAEIGTVTQGAALGNPGSCWTTPLPAPPEVIWVDPPKPSSPDWNDFAAAHPTWAAKALGELDIVKPMQDSIKGITTGARPANQ